MQRGGSSARQWKQAAGQRRWGSRTLTENDHWCCRCLNASSQEDCLSQSYSLFWLLGPSFKVCMRMEIQDGGADKHWACSLP